MKCPKVDQITDGGFKPSDATFSYGTALSFGCDFGYVRVGVETLVCQADGTWNGNIPYCKEDCKLKMPIRKTWGADPGCNEISRIGIAKYTMHCGTLDLCL